jgi:hypothetical protein
VASGQREEQHLREIHAGALPQILDQLIERIVRGQFFEQFEDERRRPPQVGGSLRQRSERAQPARREPARGVVSEPRSWPRDDEWGVMARCTDHTDLQRIAAGSGACGRLFATIGIANGCGWPVPVPRGCRVGKEPCGDVPAR